MERLLVRPSQDKSLIRHTRSAGSQLPALRHKTSLAPSLLKHHRLRCTGSGDVDIAVAGLQGGERALPCRAVVDGEALVLRDDLVAVGGAERAVEDRSYGDGLVARVAEPVGAVGDAHHGRRQPDARECEVVSTFCVQYRFYSLKCYNYHIFYILKYIFFDFFIV